MSEPSSGASADAREWLGRVLDERYRIESVLGAGGLGLVFRATHLGLDRAVAVKVLHHELLQNEGLRKRFDREVQMLSKLAHPHIVTLTDSGVLDDGVGYLVMELLEGESLEQRLDAGALVPDDAIEVCRQVLLGLDEAHDKGILHRDIKPANVFLQPLAEGRHVKLLDFGLAKVRKGMAEDPEAYSTLTATGTLVGTPTYMAPELLGNSEPGPTMDVYSLGIVLFEMLTGDPPFASEDRARTIRMHINDPVPTLEEVAPELRPTPELRAFVHKALAKDPATRFASARDMLRALDLLPSPAATVDMDVLDEAVRKPELSGTENTVELGSAELDSVLLEVSEEASAPSVELSDEDAPASEPEPEIAPTPEATRVAPPPSRHRSPVVWVVAIALAALGGVAAWIGSRDASGPEPAPDTAPPSAEEPGPVAGDLPDSPFQPGTLPAELREARRRTMRGRRLTSAQVRDLERYQQTHEDDPRPTLLLARHERLGGHWAPMVERYVAALALDEDARGFPSMLGDLVRAARYEPSHSAAADALQRIYGSAAIATVDEDLAREMPEDERERLVALRSRLGTHPTRVEPPSDE